MNIETQIAKLEKLIEEVRELQNSGLWVNLQEVKSQLYKVLNERYRTQEKYKQKQFDIETLKNNAK
jgi:hypothetical protein